MFLCLCAMWSAVALTDRIWEMFGIKRKYTKNIMYVDKKQEYIWVWKIYRAYCSYMRLIWQLATSVLLWRQAYGQTIDEAITTSEVIDEERWYAPISNNTAA